MPVNNLIVGRVIVHIDRDRPSLLETQQGTGRLLIIGNCLNHATRRDLKRIGGNVEDIIGVGERMNLSRKSGSCDCHARKPKEFAPSHRIYCNKLSLRKS